MNGKARASPGLPEESASSERTVRPRVQSGLESKRTVKNLRRPRDVAGRLIDEMTVIAEIGRLISSTLDIGEVYERFAAEVRKLIPIDRISVDLNNPAEQTFTITYVSGYDIPERRPGDIVPIKGSITEIILRTRTGLLIHPTGIEDVTHRFLGATNVSTVRAGMQSLISVPLISRDVVIGTLHLRAKRPNAYTDQDLRLAERIGAQIAGAIANAQLFKDLQDTEMSLRESEARFRALFEQAAVGVAELDIRTGRFLTVNGRLCELVGRTEEELLATTFQAITHPDDLSVHVEGMALLTAGKIGSFALEKRYIRKDGTIVWVNITLSPLWKTGEAPGRNIAVVQEITDRKRAQRENERRAKQLTMLHETGLEITAELNLNTLLQSITRRALDLIGGTYCNCYLSQPDGDLMERVASAGEEMFPSEPSRRRGQGFVGHIMETRHPLVINDYRSWPKRNRKLDAWPSRALVGTPIHWGNELLGVLNVMAYVPHRYTQTDSDMLGMFATQAAIAIRNARLYDRMRKDIAERRGVEEALKDTLNQLESRVRERTIELEEINTALRVLLKKGEHDQKNLEEILQSNVNQLVMPFLHKLRTTQTSKEHLSYLNILETNLGNIVSPFINQLSASYKRLTPKEIQVAELIKQGKRSKEIAELLGVSVGTVITHRNNIRKKLHLKSKGANLRSHLLYMA